MLLQALTAGVTIVLARLLTPADYGLFAIALSLQLAVQWIIELGLPAALIRLERNPSRELLRATSGLLLLLATTIAGVISALAFLFLPLLNLSFPLSQVSAVTLFALPFLSYRATSLALLDRRMAFDRVAVVEVADTLGFNLFALSGALAGLGVYSLALAVPVGALFGSIVAFFLAPLPPPTLSFSLLRPLLGFGSRVTALGFLYIVRDLGSYSLVAALGGAPLAGYLSMAKRFFTFPNALSAAVARVGFPLLTKNEANRSAQAASIIRMTAIVCGLPLALVAGSADQLIPLILGPGWTPTESVIMFGSVALFLGACIAAPLNSFFLAHGDPRPAIKAVLADVLVGCIAILILVTSLSAIGVGIAMSTGALIGAAILITSANSRSVLSGAAGALTAMLVAALSAAIGGYLTPGDGVLSLLTSISIISCTWVMLTFLTARSTFVSVISSLRGLLSPRRTEK